MGGYLKRLDKFTRSIAEIDNKIVLVFIFSKTPRNFKPTLTLTMA